MRHEHDIPAFKSLAYTRLYDQQIEPPTPDRLDHAVRAAIHRFEENLFDTIYQALPAHSLLSLDSLITTAPDDEIEEWFAAIAPVFKKHGIELWCVAELFPRFQDKPGIDLFRSVSFEYLMGKMKTVNPYVEKFACWEYETHLYPKSKNPGAKKLNEK